MLAGRFATMRVVPTISHFFGIVTLEVIDSNLGRRQLRFVLAWAELHQDELAENWRRARGGETLRKIEPLR